MTREHGRFITHDEAQAIANDAAEKGSDKAIRSAFALLGVDLDDFESVQDFRGDLQWLKSGRRVSKAVGSKAGSSIVGVMSVGIIIGVYDWVRTFFTHVAGH